jgi:hypothetical protein
MGIAGHGDVGELRPFIEANEREIWERFCDNVLDMHETRRQLRDDL